MNCQRPTSTHKNKSHFFLILYYNKHLRCPHPYCVATSIFIALDLIGGENDYKISSPTKFNLLTLKSISNYPKVKGQLLRLLRLNIIKINSYLRNTWMASDRAKGEVYNQRKHPPCVAKGALTHVNKY